MRKFGRLNDIPGNWNASDANYLPQVWTNEAYQGRPANNPAVFRGTPMNNHDGLLTSADLQSKKKIKRKKRRRLAPLESEYPLHDDGDDG